MCLDLMTQTEVLTVQTQQVEVCCPLTCDQTHSAVTGQIVSCRSDPDSDILTDV